MKSPTRLSTTYPAPLYDWLQSEAERFGISVGEFIRRKLDQVREIETKETRK